MCGRYLLRNPIQSAGDPPWNQYWRELSVFSPRYNICPSESSAVIRRRDGQVVCEKLQWGFKPAWSKYKPVINARAEKLLSSGMFRDSARCRRCLVLADGFYEPKGPQGARNRPWYLFEFQDQHPFAIAGIWVEEGFTIITCDANSIIEPVHDRMPLIIDSRDWSRWLDENLEDREVVSLLLPREYPGMISRPVSDYVKKAGNEGPRCTENIASA